MEFTMVQQFRPIQSKSPFYDYIWHTSSRVPKQELEQAIVTASPPINVCVRTTKNGWRNLPRICVGGLVSLNLASVAFAWKLLQGRRRRILKQNSEERMDVASLHRSWFLQTTINVTHNLPRVCGGLIALIDQTNVFFVWKHGKLRTRGVLKHTLQRKKIWA